MFYLTLNSIDPKKLINDFLNHLQILQNPQFSNDYKFSYVTLFFDLYSELLEFWHIYLCWKKLWNANF